MIKKEWQAILKNKFFMVVLVALALIPALYNLIFLSSMWDPYGKISNLPVAVVNQDQPTTVNGKTVNLGQELVDELGKSHDLDYHFVTHQKAQKGLKSDKYYMQITIPSDFSKNAGSLVSDKPTEAVIDYQTSKGHNFIASKMSESAMAKLKAKVSENITATYTKTIFANLSDLSNGMADAANGSQKIVSGSKDLQAGSTEIGSNLNNLSTASVTFKDGANTLNAGLGQYTSGVSSLATHLNDMTGAVTQFKGGTQQVAAGTNQLNTGSSQLSTALSEMSSKMALTPDQEAQLAALQAALPQLNKGIQDYNTTIQNTPLPSNLVADLQGIATSAQAILDNAATEQVAKLSALKGTAAYQNASAADKATLEGLMTVDTSQVPAIQAALMDAQSQLNKLKFEWQMNQGALAQIAAGANQVIPGANQAISDLTTGLNTAKSALDTQIIPGAQGMTQGVSELNTHMQDVATKAGQLQTGSSELASGASELNQNSAQLLAGTGQLTNGAQAISEGAGKLATAENTLTSGILTLQNGATTLATGLTDAKTKLTTSQTTETNAEKIAAPLKLKHKDTDNSSANGVGMAPYMISVALFVGAVATNMIITGSLSSEKAKNRRDYLLGKIGVNGVIAIAEGVLVYGAVHLLGLSANHEVAMFGFTMLVSLAFMLIVTFFNTWLGKPGAFLMLILLLLQLAASAGTYPLALTSAFFQKINPWMPMTYAVTGFRQVISLAGSIGQQTGIMLMLIAVFLVLLPLAGYKKAKS
jgi:putative membrane protein